MKYRYMGLSGLLVSRITLGAMTFGVREWGCDEKTSHAIIKRYLDLGGNHIDVADVYSGGKAEEIVGSFLPQVRRDEVTIASKAYFPSSGHPNAHGVSRHHVMAACEQSLRKLGTDYIDLYYIHGPDPVTPVEETMRALDDLVRQGKVRYLGCSNLFGWQLAKAQGVAERMSLEPLRAGQYLYNLVDRSPEREIIPSAVDHGVGLFCFSPLAGGMLTGKYKGQGDPAEGSRLAHRTKVDGPRFWHERGFRAVQAVEEVAGDSGIPAHKLAIAWPLGRRFVSSVIIGVTSVDQLEANMEMGDWDLPQEVWNALEERTRPEEDWLTWFAKANHSRFHTGSEFHDETRELP